jgi:hypothetical protein
MSKFSGSESRGKQKLHLQWERWHLVVLIRIHLLVLFLYMMRYPHSRHRIGSRGLISFSWWHSIIENVHNYLLINYSHTMFISITEWWFAWSAQRIPTAVNLFSRPKHFFIQVAPQLSSWGWVDTVPDSLLLRKSGRAGNRTRDLWICSQKLWPLDHRGGL